MVAHERLLSETCTIIGVASPFKKYDATLAVQDRKAYSKHVLVW